MAHAIQKTLLGFLSTAVFFAAFFLIGDVLIAAFTAFVFAVVQFILTRTATNGSGLAILASLVVVIALTSLSLKGDDTFAAADAAQVSTTDPNCHCSAQKSANPVRATIVPFREIPKTLAPARGGV